MLLDFLYELFEVSAALFKITVFWDMTPCRLIFVTNFCEDEESKFPRGVVKKLQMNMGVISQNNVIFIGLILILKTCPPFV